MVESGEESQDEGFLFDTNVVIAAFEQEEAVTRRLEGSPADALFVPVVVLGEMDFGARKASRAVENLRRLEEFAAEANVLPCDRDTARFYGEIKDRLRRKGRPIPENDIWIAAVARQHGLVLVSRDSHFEHVEELEVESW